MAKAFINEIMLINEMLHLGTRVTSYLTEENVY